MSTEKPTTPKDGAPALSPEEHWCELQVRAGGESDAHDEITTSQVKSEDTAEVGRHRALTRRARIVVAAALTVLAVALAWIVVPTLVGGGSTPRSRPTPGGLKAGKAGGGRSSQTRWVREPDQAARPRRRRTATSAPHVRHHAQPRHELQRPAPPPSDDPSQPPASGAAPPEPAPEPSAPAPPPPSEPAGKPGLRDGATESTEFGL